MNEKEARREGEIVRNPENARKRKTQNKQTNKPTNKQTNKQTNQVTNITKQQNNDRDSSFSTKALKNKLDKLR